MPRFGFKREGTARKPERRFGCLLALATALSGSGAVAEDCADPALVLAIDGSGSIDTVEYVTQLEGYQAALASSAVRHALAQAGRVRIGPVLWGDDAMPSTIFPLRSVDDPQALDAFGAELRWAGRRTWGNTGIGAAIWLSLDLLAASEYCAARRVINVSGDGRSLHGPIGPYDLDSDGYVAPEAARARAVAEGVTVNPVRFIPTTSQPSLSSIGHGNNWGL